jgi:transposase
MFFRTKSVKGTPLLQLVESYRNEEGQPRQRVLASLGDAQLPEGESKLIAAMVADRLSGVTPMIEPEISEEASVWVTRILQIAARSKSARVADAETVDGVLVDGITSDNVVQLGPQLVAMHAWQQLGLSAKLEELGLNSGTIATVQLLVSNRLIEPLSEWALIDWAGRTALPELLDLRLTKTVKDRLYRAGDALFKHRKAIESFLREREAQLFNSRRSIILYDVTNTHFEGLCQNNPKARHGRNKQKRDDCRQVAVGMAFDERGLPLAHEVFEGNISDSKTLEIMLDRLQLPSDGHQPPIVILDAGFASAQNLELLKKRKLGYLVNITRSSRSRYADAFAGEGFETVAGRKPADKVEVKTIADPDDEDSQLVLCRSARRREKEMAMLSKAEGRFLKDIKALQERIKKGQLKDPAKMERAIGRLQKKHPRVQRFYQLEVQSGELSASRYDERHKEANDLLGDYVLKTHTCPAAAETWSLYMTLLQAEEGYACLKGSLGLRPNFHQLEERVETHVFISVLAYHLLVWMRETLRESDELRDWKTLRRLLSTHSLVTTRLPLADKRVLEIRKPSLPDAEQARIYQLLGVDWKAAYPTVKTYRQKLRQSPPKKKEPTVL